MRVAAQAHGIVGLALTAHSANIALKMVGLAGFVVNALFILGYDSKSN